jgi:hypothetical protein
MQIDPTIWLDTVRSVPIVGLRMEDSFDSHAAILDRLKRLIRKWAQGDAQSKIKVSVGNDQMVKIERPDGYEIRVAHNNAVCRFFYVSRMEEYGSRQPRVTYQSAPKGISELTSEAIDTLLEVVSELARDSNRVAKRYGVAVTGSVDYDNMPPGFQSYLNSLATPWEHGLVALDSRITARISETDRVLDRCHHQLKWSNGDDDDDELQDVLSYTIDWQRLHRGANPTPVNRIREEFENVRAAAFAYFGRFGVGELDNAQQ